MVHCVEAYAINAVNAVIADADELGRFWRNRVQ
jgi:hypothetical protein